MPEGSQAPQNPAQAENSLAMGYYLPMAIGTATTLALLEMGNEAVRFIWDRLQQDIKSQQAMAACTSLDQLRRIQTDFFTTAQAQYTQEAGKMLALMGKVKTAPLAASAHARRFDDVPL